MPKRVLIFDTSILCCLLKVPGKETAGTNDDRWDHDRVRNHLAAASADDSTFVLPLASIVETGNHIAQAPGDRFAIAKGLEDLIRSAADQASPWAAFAEQAELWGTEALRRLADTWPVMAGCRESISDATIRDVAEYYARAGFAVEILTADAGLKAYQPAEPVMIPRRRR